MLSFLEDTTRVIELSHVLLSGGWSQEPIKESLYLHWFPAKSIIFLFSKPRTVKKKMLTLLFFQDCEVFVVVGAFRFTTFFLWRSSQEVFWLAKFSFHFCYQKMLYFHSTSHRPYQNFRHMSHVISLRCPQPDRMHVGKTMIVIALFWLARQTEEAFY